MQRLQPSLFLQRPHYRQGLVFIRQLLDLTPRSALVHMFDVLILHGGVIPRLRALVHRPVKTHHKAAGPDHPRRILQEGVVVQDAQQLGLQVGHPVGGVEQKPARPGVEGERHGIHRKVTAAQVLHDGSIFCLWRLTWLAVFFRVRPIDSAAHAAGKLQQYLVLVSSLDLSARLLQFSLQSLRIAFNREVQIANGKAADNVANGPAGEVKVNAVGASGFLHERNRSLLLRREPAFHHVDVIGHARNRNPGLAALNGRQRLSCSR